MKRTTYSEAAKAAEVGMVGFAMNYPGRLPEIDLEPHHFFDLRLQRVWGAIRRMSDEGVAIDEKTAAARLERDGAPDCFSLLVQASLQAAIFPEDTAAIVRDAWLRRQVAVAASEVISAHDQGVAGDELLSLALEKLSGVHAEQPEKSLGIGELVGIRFRQLSEIADARAKGKVAVTGIPTGIRRLDELLGGLQRGICTVVAGRPGMGKSAFGMACTKAATKLGVGVHVFSFEDTREAYTDRAISGESGIAAERLRAGELERHHLGAITDAVDRVRALKGWLVDDRSGITAEEIVRTVRRSAARNATQLVVVDYAQLVSAPRDRGPMKKHEQVAHVMDVLSNAAKKDGMAYLVLAQLNRSCESRDNKRPMLSDLKESGALEERAKCVLMLYRPAVYREIDPETKQPYPEDRLELLLRKNNHGRTGKVLAHWHGPTTRIE